MARAARSAAVVVAAAAAAASLLCADAALDRITISTSDRQFRDGFGRLRLFRGTNDVEKNEPFLSSFTDAELVRMAEEWGYNLLRLGWSWEGYERQRGVKDAAYMEATSVMIDRLEEVGIYTLLDSHQDLVSRKFCGKYVPRTQSRPDVGRETR